MIAFAQNKAGHGGHSVSGYREPTTLTQLARKSLSQVSLSNSDFIGLRGSPTHVSTVVEKNMSVRPKELGAENPAQIEQGRREHEGILMRLMRSINDSEGAMRMAESVFGLGYWPQCNLRFKRRATQDFLSQVHFVWLSVLENSVKRDLATLKEMQADAPSPFLSRLEIEADALASEIHEALK